MQLWGIRPGNACQGVTHNNSLKTQSWEICHNFPMRVFFFPPHSIFTFHPKYYPLQVIFIRYQISVLAAVSNLFLFAIVGLIRDPSTAGAGPTTMTQTSTTSTRGTPSSTKRLSVSTANTQERSNRTWRGAQRCRTFSHRRIHCFVVDFIYSLVQKVSENLNHTGIFWFLPFQQYIRAGLQNVLCLHHTWCWFVQN